MNCYFKYIMLVVASVFALSSCEEKEVEVYGNEAYLVFEMPGYGLTNTPRDSMVFSFPYCNRSSNDSRNCMYPFGRQ